jgi:hypothetical protein
MDGSAGRGARWRSRSSLALPDRAGGGLDSCSRSLSSGIDSSSYSLVAVWCSGERLAWLRGKGEVCKQARELASATR